MLPNPGESTHFLDDKWTDFVIQGMEERGAKPYMCYLTLAAAHSPLQAPESALSLYPPSMFLDRRVYAAMMTQLDRNVGRLVDAFKSKGMWQDTLMIFTSVSQQPASTCR